MLIESACSVERVEEAMSTLLPMLPDIHYFRFNPGSNSGHLAFVLPLVPQLFFPYFWAVFCGRTFSLYEPLNLHEYLMSNFSLASGRNYSLFAPSLSQLMTVVTWTWMRLIRLGG